MDNDVKAFWCGIAMGFFAGSLIAAMLALSCNDQHWQHDAIQRGYAQYDTKTGAWKWKEERDAND